MKLSLCGIRGEVMKISHERFRHTPRSRSLPLIFPLTTVRQPKDTQNGFELALHFFASNEPNHGSLARPKVPDRQTAMTASRGIASESVLAHPKRSGLQRFLDELGPGLITGAADD